MRVKSFFKKNKKFKIGLITSIYNTTGVRAKMADIYEKSNFGPKKEIPKVGNVTTDIIAK